MLDLNFIRENTEKVKEGVKNRGYDPKIIDRLLKVDETRRQLIADVEKWRQARNKLTKKDIKRGKKIKEMLRRLEPDLRAVEEQVKELLYQIPNLAADDVPVGKDENDNVVVRKVGKPKKFSFKPKDHLELGEALDIIDVKRAAKVSGSRFGYLIGDAALLEFALIQFALELLAKEGFLPVVPPVMIKKKMELDLGYSEQGGWEEMYLLPKDDLVLVATAEHSLVSMHAEEVFDIADLPKRYVGFSTCFRREAGTYGKDTRGILRVHQFDKVEMVSFTKPENSDKEHEYLVSLQEKLMQALKLPYRISKMCTGDLAHPQKRRYDVETWLPGEGKYRETHSCSNCTDYQSRRLGIRFKEAGKAEYVHVLNGTAFAIGRTIIAILENCQQKDGSVIVPEVLQKYTGFKKISPKK